MLKRIVGAVILSGLLGCPATVPPEVLQKYQSKTLYTCCNIHHEKNDINDANYYVGTLLPLGTPAQVQGLGNRSATFSAGGTTLTLTQSYGTAQESFEVYLDKILVSEDPKAKVATYPQAVQDAIRDARVEKGMTRDQVILSLGYPPTHKTASLNDRLWTYWYNRYVTFQVAFDEAGKVSNVVGGSAPTTNVPIPDAPAPRATPATKKRR